MKKMIILRGPSGSGKSTYVRENYPSAIVCSADNFFLEPCKLDKDSSPIDMGFAIVNEGGFICHYKFDPYLLPEAHADCLRHVLSSIQKGCPTIVVDNTHLARWEYENYVQAAKLGGYEVEIVEFVVEKIATLKILAERNSHKVPIEAIIKQFLKFEPDDKASVTIMVDEAL